jgi:hypothetical protein
MGAGKPSDSILGDIVGYRIPRISPEADDLVRRLAALCDTRQLYELDAWLEQAVLAMASEDPPNDGWLPLPGSLAERHPLRVQQLTAELREALQRRRADARRRGWEVD